MDTLREVFNRYKGDIISGITVAAVALPLALAFGIASGAGATAGLYAAIFAGFVTSLFGGSAVQVSGPSGAMVVVLVSVIKEYGIEGMIVASAMAGALQLLLGFMGLGRLVKYLPQPVVAGFTNGIAVIIFLSQVESALGSPIITIVTIAAIIGARLFAPKLPSSLIGLAVGIIVNALFVNTPHVVGALPFSLPVPSLPIVPFEVINALLLPAFTICLLGSIETLLSAEVVDAMTGQSHDSNRELISQGLGNIVSASVGGVPVAGAVARTAVNVKAGGRTRIAGMTSSVVLFFIVMLFGEQAQGIPLAALSAILMVTAVGMVDWQSLARMRRASRTYTVALLTTMVLIITHDLVVGVAVGSLIAVFSVFVDLAKYPAVSNRKPKDESGSQWPAEANVNVLHLHGPLYFVGMQGLIERLSATPAYLVHVLDFSNAPMIDDSAALALKAQITKLASRGIHLYIAGVTGDALRTLARLGMLDGQGRRRICKDPKVAMQRAVAEATSLLEVA